MKSNHKIFNFDITYPAFEYLTKHITEELVKNATGSNYLCERTDDAELLSNTNDKHSNETLEDSVSDSKSQLEGYTRFFLDRQATIFYNLPSQELYQQEDPIYWFARHVENIFHECRHINDFSSVFCDTKSEKARFSSLLHLVASNNPGFDIGENGTGHDLANYSHDINEIRAELYGFYETSTFLKNYFFDVDEKYIDAVMLELINDKIKETDGHYCLCLNQTSPLKSIDELPALIKKSIDNAYKQPFVYTLDKSNLRRDSLAQCLNQQKYNPAFGYFQKEKDPFEQIRMMATITLDGVTAQHNAKVARNEQNAYTNLQNVDLSDANFFNSCFSSRSLRAAAFNAWKTILGINPYFKQPYDSSYKDDFDDFNYI